MKILMTLLGLASLCWAGAPDTIWTKRFGNSLLDYASGGTADFSGGYVLTGSYQHPTGPRGQDLFAVRVDALTGDSVFARTYGGNSSEQGADVHWSSLRTVFVGPTSSFGSNTPNVYVVATNALGDTIWTRAFDSGWADAVLAVDRSPSGDYFIGGHVTQLGNLGLLLMKMDSTGTLLWTRTLGGSGTDWMFDALATSDGGCVLAGETSSYGINTPNRTNAWLVKYDAAGDTVWTKTFGDSAQHERFDAVVLANDGGLLCVGARYSLPGTEDVFVVKTDANGDEEWIRTYGGSGNDRAMDVAVSCENYTLAGYTDSYGAGGQDGYLIEIDQNGDTLWTKTVGGADDDRFSALSSGCNQWYDAGYYAAGMTENNASGPQDAWLVKFAADPQIWFTSPAWCEHYVIGNTITAIWGFQGFEAFPYLSLELNRDYPNGIWEMINPSFYNSGFLNFAATAPTSSNCRLRVTKLDGGFAQAISEAFSIIPTGALTSPVMDWDSSWNGGVGIRDFIATDEAAFVYPYGSSIIKRDSIGDTVWTANFSFGNNSVFSDRICQLASGDYVTIATVDTLYGLPAFMVCTDSGTAVTPSYFPNLPDTAGFIDVAATDSGGFWLLSGKAAGYYNLAYVWHSENNDWADTVNAGVSFLPRACALTDGGLMVAGQIGDVWVNQQDIFLVGVNNDYDTLWTKRHNFGENDYATRLVRFSSGVIYLLGNQLEAIGGTWRGFIAALDESGNVLEQWNYVDRDEAQLWGIAEDIDGRIIASGSSKYIAQASDFVLVKYDCSGQMDWELNPGGANSEHFFAVSAMSDGGYLACGDRYFPSGGGFGTDRPTAIKFGSETYYTPPECPPADSLVIKKDDYTSSVTLTWQGEEQGVYFIYASATPDDYPGGGWSQIACVEPIAPARATLTWTDYDLSPEKKFYVVVHDCNQSCGGGEN